MPVRLCIFKREKNARVTFSGVMAASYAHVISYTYFLLEKLIIIECIPVALVILYKLHVFMEIKVPLQVSFAFKTLFT